MTAFNYTTGNPSNLTGGANASMNDIAGPFTDLRTFLNGGNIDFSNLAATVQSDYQEIRQIPTTFSSADISAATSYSVYGGGSGIPGTTAGAAFAFDPADYALIGRTAKYRIKVSMLCNATAPGITFTFGLATPTIAYGATNVFPTISAITPVGSTAVITTPSASATTVAVSADFAAPASGLLEAYVTASAAMASGSRATVLWSLQRRTV
jgi:hypothetical protein